MQNEPEFRLNIRFVDDEFRGCKSIFGSMADILKELASINENYQIRFETDDEPDGCYANVIAINYDTYDIYVTASIRDKGVDV